MVLSAGVAGIVLYQYKYGPPALTNSNAGDFCYVAELCYLCVKSPSENSYRLMGNA